MARPILVEIFADATQFQSELDRAAGRTRRFGAVAGVVGGILATGLAIGLEKSVRAALDAQAAHARLETAFHNVGLSADDYTKQIAKAEAAGRQLGFADEQTVGSLGSLVTATHSVTASLRDLSVAQDLARFKHVDLEQATKMLTMAMTGSQRAVKQLGIIVPPVTTAVDALKRSNVDLATAAGQAELAHAKLQDKLATGQAIIDAVSAKVRGQGQAFSETAAGGMAQFTAQLNHLEVTIGEGLLPVLTRLLATVNGLVAEFNANFAPAINTAKAAFDRLHGATVLMYSLFLPVREMLAVWRVEIAALTGAIRGGEVAFNALRAAGSAVAAFFTNVFHGAVTAAHAVVSGLNSALEGVRGALNAIRSAAESVAGLFRGALTGSFNAFRAVAGGISSVINAIAGALRAAAGAARALAGALSSIHVPHISLPSIHIPNVPGFASGVAGFAGGMALVGERGPELVTLPRGANVIPSGGFGGAGVIENNIVVEMDGQVIWRGLKRHAVRDQLRNGSTGLR